jgi:hypothetical protein
VPIYRDADFDSPIIAHLSSGKTYEISRKKFNQAFYRIRFQPSLLGYVSDADVRVVSAPRAGTTPGVTALPTKTTGAKQIKPFQYTQYAGLQLSSVNYLEETMAGKREENLSFFGVKVSGPNVVVAGEMPTELNVLFYLGAPAYYQRITGRNADGWILLMDFRFQNYYPQSKNTLLFGGFGPLVKYSKLNLGLGDAATKVTSYSAEDLVLGGVFNVGLAQRLGRVALRGEAQYFWEKTRYLGLGLSLQFAF